MSTAEDWFGAPEPGEISEDVEARFGVTAPPRLRVRNVSGRTSISASDAREVFVRARKRVRGTNPERAARMLENVEVRMKADGDEIKIEPRLYEEARGWLQLLRGGDVAVDLYIEVPREAQLDVRSVSGAVRIEGVRGRLEIEGASAELEIEDVHGPLRLKTVSGDVRARAYFGRLEANSVSGDLRFERSRLRSPEIVTVSGDVRLDGEIGGPDEGRVKTVSGDVDLALADGAYQISFRSVSGHCECDIPSRTTSEGRRERRLVIGEGGPVLEVRSVSGDLTIHPSSAPASGAAEDRAERQAQAAELAGERAEAEPAAGGRGRLLRIRVTEHGKSKVNVAIPLAIARIGKMKLGSAGLVKGHLAKFGIDLDDLLREVETAGRIVDISDDEDRVEIFVE